MKAEEVASEMDRGGREHKSDIGYMSYLGANSGPAMDGKQLARDAFVGLSFRGIFLQEHIPSVEARRILPRCTTCRVLIAGNVVFVATERRKILRKEAMQQTEERFSVYTSAGGAQILI